MTWAVYFWTGSAALHALMAISTCGRVSYPGHAWGRTSWKSGLLAVPDGLFCLGLLLFALIRVVLLNA
jgi:hypothetical protein